MSDVLKTVYPDLPLSNDLDNRIARLAHEAESRRTNRRHYTIGFRFAAMAGLALPCVVLGAIFLPRIAAARTLQRATDALRQVQSIHTSGWMKSSDGHQQHQESWQSGPCQRIDTDNGAQITVFTGAKLYRYDASRHRTTVQWMRQFATFESSGPTLTDLQTDLRRWGWKDTLEFLPDQAEEGRILHRVRISRDEPAGPVRIELWVDPMTDLPIRADILLYQNGSWQRYGSSRMNYNEALDKDRFAPPLPPGTALEDLDQKDHLWRERLAKGIASTVVGGRRVVVRSVETDSTGNIFVLYTAGKSAEDAFHTDEQGIHWYYDTRDQGRDWEWKITNAQGIHYARQTADFETDIASKTRHMPLGARPIIEGEKLEMDWFVPLTAETSQVSPGQVMMTIRTAAQNLHGQALYDFGNGRSIHPGSHPYTATATIVIQTTPLQDTVPSWWERFIDDGSREAIPVKPEQTIGIKAAQLRADHFVWDTGARNLPVALYWLTVEDGLRRADDPERSDLHFRFAECLGMMGHTQEARAEVDRAVDTWPDARKDRTPLYTGAAGICRSLGDEAAAQAFIQRAIAESPAQRDWLEKSRAKFRRW